MPDKVITDPVHGDIYVNVLERRLIDSEPLQRLRRVRQLANTHLVYPGATHSRFSHALGALRAAQDLIDAILAHRHRRDPPEDLFSLWARDPNPDTYLDNIAEVVVLARLGALLHDIGHIPFGHTIEDELGILVAHDRNDERYERLWSRLLPELRQAIPAELTQELRRIILSKKSDAQTLQSRLSTSGSLWNDLPARMRELVAADLAKELTAFLPVRSGAVKIRKSVTSVEASTVGLAWRSLPASCQEAVAELLTPERDGYLDDLESREGEHCRAAEGKYPFVADIVGNTICADLVDYLPRDHLNTGLPIALGHRFIERFYVTTQKELYFPMSMVLLASQDGRERPDVISEVLKYLRYRYELSERALAHHAKLAADAMIAKLLAMWSDAVWLDLAQSEYPDTVFSDEEVRDVDGLRRGIRHHQVVAIPSDASQGPAVTRRLDAEMRSTLERMFLRHGDDGFMETLWLEALHRSRATPEDASQPAADLAALERRWAAIARLVRSVLDRDLFKGIGHVEHRELATRIYAKFGTPSERHRVEQTAADYADLQHSWQVVLWVPPPTMRLKAAEVTVEIDGSIAPLTDHDRIGAGRAQEIYAAHEALWGVGIYAAPSVKNDAPRTEVVLAKLQELLGVPIRDWQGRAAPAIVDVVVRRVAMAASLPINRQSELAAVCEPLPEAAAARGSDRFHALAIDAWRAAQAEGLIGESKPIPEGFPWLPVSTLLSA